MNFQQIRYVYEVVRRGLNVSEAAEALFTSQPGVSKQIRLLEQELGVDIFVRHGKRLVGITEPGKQILVIAGRMLRDMGNLRLVGEEFSHEREGRLSLATTHTQARYVLPPVVRAFVERYPAVRLSLHQGSPRQVCDMVLDGEADLAIAADTATESEDLVLLPCFQWNRCIIVPYGHPLLEVKNLSLEVVSRYPLVTYDDAFSGRSLINKAFLGRGLKPNIVLTAIDSDVIKTYVAMGLGVGIVARMAYDAKHDADLAMMDAAHLFESATTRIALHRNAYLRGYVYSFIEYCAPHLTRQTVDQAMKGRQQESYEL